MRIAWLRLMIAQTCYIHVILMPMIAMAYLVLRLTAVNTPMYLICINLPEHLIKIHCLIIRQWVSIFFLFKNFACFKMRFLKILYVWKNYTAEPTSNGLYCQIPYPLNSRQQYHCQAFDFYCITTNSKLGNCTQGI